LPIHNHANREEILSLTIKFSKIWKYCKQFKLTKNKRVAPEEVHFNDFLIRVGNGTMNDENEEIQLPDHSIIKGDLTDEIFQESIKNKNYAELSKRAILCPYNEQVTMQNEKVLNMLESSEKIYYSTDRTEKGHQNEGRPEFLNKCNSANIPLHKLKLKINATIMLIRNLHVEKGLCNGTRIRITRLTENLIIGEIINGSKAGEIAMIHRITICDDSSFTFKLWRHQFPVKLAFAMTINKAQGQTLDKVGLDLTIDVFSHGQLYVALSRVRSWSSMKIKLLDENEERKVKNVVFKEVFD